MNKTIFSTSILAGLLIINSYALAVNIIVNYGNFKTVEDAADSEKETNWWDNNLQDDAACTESFAAIELAKFLPECFEIKKGKIIFADTSHLPAEGDIFLLGTQNSNPLIKTFLSTEPNLQTDQSFTIRSIKQNERLIIVIEGKTHIGVLYGVYEYLKLNGIRFYGLGENGTVLPAVKSKNLNANINCTQNPSFLTRGFFVETKKLGNSDLFLWMARNKINLWTSDESEVCLFKKLGFNLSAGGHSLMAVCLNPTAQYPYNHPKFEKDNNLPTDPYPTSNQYKGDIDSNGKLSYFEAHPEWYSLISEKRVPKLKDGTGNNYCTSNKDATNEFAKNILHELVAGKYKHTDILNVWLLDNGKWCQCENCDKAGSCTDKVIDIIQVILNTLNNAKKQGILQRNVIISTCAYHETLSPPTKKLPDDFNYDNFMITFFPIERCYVHSLADEKCTEINAELNSDYLKWVYGENRTYKGNICIGEYYNVSSIMSLPAVYPKIMAADIPYYYKTGTRYFNYMHCPTTKWGTWTLNQSLMAKLLWNAKTDANEYLNEYFANYYPTTDKYIRDFYKNLEDAFANIKALKHYVIIGKRYSVRGKLDKDTEEIFPLKHLKYDVFRSNTDDGPDIVEMMESMNKAGICIETALLYCSNKIEKQRLTEDYRRYQYGLTMYNFYYRMIRTAMFHRQGDKAMAKAEFAKIIEYANTLDNFRDLIMLNQNGTQKTGMEATQAEKQFNFFQNLYGNAKQKTKESECPK